MSKRITFLIHQEANTLGFLSVDEMLKELTADGISTTEVMHRAIRLLHRQAFPVRYAETNCTPLDQASARIRDFHLIGSGIRIPVRDVAQDQDGSSETAMAHLLNPPPHSK